MDGWAHTGLKVATLAAGAAVELPAAGEERIVVPLNGSFTATVDGEDFRLAGRASVFNGPSDVLYTGTGKAVTISSADGGRVAVATAPGEDLLPDPARDGRRDPGGAAGRRQLLPAGAQLRHPGRAGSRPLHRLRSHHPGRQLVLLSPAQARRGKGRRNQPRGDLLLRDPGGTGRSGRRPARSGDAIGYQRVYASDERPIDVSAEVRTGDVVLVPYGWHGPAMAAPGYDLYYLNVMAGPGPVRDWLISDDPHHGWIRQTWEGQDVDPRLPFGA